MTFFGVAIHVATIAILLQLYCNSVANPEIFTLKTRIRVAINCNF